MNRMLTYTTNEDDLQDYVDYLNLIKEGNEALARKTEGEGEKKPNIGRKKIKHDLYCACVADGARTIAYQFLMSPILAGSRMDNDQNAAMSTHPQPSAAPEELVDEAVLAGTFKTLKKSDDDGDGNINYVGTEKLLKSPVYVAAMELAFEPRIRKALREVFEMNAYVSTKPTAKGRNEIDFFHELYGLQHLSNVPLTKYLEDMSSESESLEYLRLLKAEKTGHIETVIHLPVKEDSLAKLMGGANVEEEVSYRSE